MDTGLFVIDWVTGHTAHRAAVVLGLNVKKKVGMLHLNGCGDVHSSCLERWTKVKKLTVLMRTRTSNLLVFRSDVLPLGHRDELRHFKDHIWHASYIQLHKRIRTRRDEKNIFKSLCRSQNLPCFLFERLFEEVNQL